MSSDSETDDKLEFLERTIYNHFVSNQSARIPNRKIQPAASLILHMMNPKIIWTGVNVENVKWVSQYQRRCCWNPKNFDDDIFDGKQCITETDAFESVCLNKYVLQAAIGTWNDSHHEDRNLENNNFRFVAYKQYISWSYGYLGKRRRKPLPNCAIIKIQQKYPDPNNAYVPYTNLAWNCSYLWCCYVS